MKLFHTKILLIISTFLISASQLNNVDSGYSIVKKMFDKTATINSLTYTITKKERIDGEIIKQISFTKMELTPFKVYIRQSFPKDGMEIIYAEGKYNNKAIINPNGFPWINIKLNPNEDLMRNNQHHTIFQSGFDHVISILEFICNKYSNEIGKMVINNGTIYKENIECYSITLTNPYFEYIDYTIIEDETIEDIALRYKLSAYMIMENNSAIKDYDDIYIGQVIKIPNDYSPKMNLLIDKEKLTPVLMEVFDHMGLYESYEYSNVSINPTITTEEFSKDWSEYGF
jgi:outer membrane lipoprotein-sorting protein